MPTSGTRTRQHRQVAGSQSMPVSSASLELPAFCLTPRQHGRGTLSLRRQFPVPRAGGGFNVQPPRSDRKTNNVDKPGQRRQQRRQRQQRQRQRATAREGKRARDSVLRRWSEVALLALSAVLAQLPRSLRGEPRLVVGVAKAVKGRGGGQSAVPGPRGRGAIPAIPTAPTAPEMQACSSLRSGGLGGRSLALSTSHVGGATVLVGWF